MATFISTTSITGRINGRSVSITLTHTITNISYYLDRPARLPIDNTMQSLNDLSALPPLLTNADIQYVRLDNYVAPANGRLGVTVITAASASTGVFELDPGQWVELGRAEAGGQFADGASATASTMEVIASIEQAPTTNMTVTTSLLVVFKPIS